MLDSKAGDNVRSGDVDAVIDGEEMYIRIGGNFGIALAPEVREAVKRGLDARVPSIIIDMRKVDYIDSSGIGTLVMALKGVNRMGGRLQVLGVPEQAKKLLKFPPFCEDGEFTVGLFGD
jgi:anti-anti-sigma factor